MGPGIAIKAAMQRKFSLLVFGWTQIVIDIEPLIFHIAHRGQHHGYTHNYLGATLIAVFSAITGKYLSEFGLRIINRLQYLPINWPTALISAFIGAYSHVFLDSLIHLDVTPFAPFSLENSVTGRISTLSMDLFCLFCAIAGGLVCLLQSKINKSH